MDLVKIISHLRAEKGVLDEAIILLENLAQGGASGVRKKRTLETRRKMAIAQRKRWAAARKAPKA